MELKNLLDDDWLDSYNQEHDIMDESQLGDDYADDDFLDNLDEEEEDGEAPDFIDEVEHSQATGEGMSQEDIDDFSDAFVDGIRITKDLISDFFKTKFGKLVKIKFPAERKRHLFVCTYADQKKKLDIEGVAEVLGLLQKHSKKYEEIEFDELLESMSDYIEMKRRYRAKELQDYQVRGLKRNFGRVLNKYVSGPNADPLAMLAIYMGLAFGPDGINAYFAYQELSELKEEEEAQRQAA